MEERNSCLFLLLIYFALAIYLLPPVSQTSTELTNWATAASLVEKKSFDISWTNDLIGENAEIVKTGENTYSKNPPGISVLAAPFYAMTRIFLGEPNAENFRTSLFIMRFLVSTLPLFFLAVWLCQQETDAFSLASLLFATPLFVFNFLLLPDVLAAALIYLAFRLLYDARRISLRNNFWAGILAGFVLICAFSAAIPALIFGFGLFFTERRDRYRRLFFFGLGILPFIVLLSIYNYLIFDSFFGNFLGAEIGFPSLSNLYRILFSPLQGLFFYAPILLFSVVAFFTSRENETLRKRVKIATILFSIPISACFPANSVRTFGAENVVFILPLLLDSFFDGEIEEFPSLWLGFLFAVSFLLCTIPALVFSLAPPESGFPHNNFWGYLIFKENFFTPTLLSLFNAPNTFWTISPAILLLLSAIYLVWRNAKNPLKFLIGILAAFLAVGIYLLIPGLDNSETQDIRQQIIDQNR